MYNLLISLAVGVAVALALAFGTNLGVVAAVFPGLLVAAVVYFLLARRSFKKIEGLFEVVQREAQAQKIDRAIQTLQGGFVHAPWQFFVAAQLHAQIGYLLYIRQDVDQALPHLEKSFGRHWIARGMLAAAKYRKRDVAGATKVLEEAVKVNKKEGLLWALYAWILEKEGRHEEAIRVLGRGAAASPSDERLKTGLQTLQNGKKLKLGKLYQEHWFQFRLEDPPPQFAGGGGFRPGRRAIYRG